VRSKLAPITLALSLAACGPSKSAPKRVELVQVGPSSFKLIPAAGQPPFCLVLTMAESGIVRQLTPLEPNEAIPCPAGEPIGGVTYKIPPAEGKAKIFVVFSDRKIDGHPVATQVREMGANPAFSAMDLRAPGNVVLEKLELKPSS
jgi:hypothetical protein